MGIDCRVHIEAKIDGQWEHWNAPYIERNRKLFDKMRGRGDETHIVKDPRGLPEDATKTTRWDSDDLSGFGHSWFSAKESAELVSWMSEWMPVSSCEWCTVDGADFREFVEDRRDREPDPKYRAYTLTDFRIVFWFDC